MGIHLCTNSHLYGKRCRFQLHPYNCRVFIFRYTREMENRLCVGYILYFCGNFTGRQTPLRPSYADFFGGLCADALESFSCLLGLMGSDYNTARKDFGIPKFHSSSYIRYFGSSCSIQILPYHEIGVKECVYIYEKQKLDRY